MSIITNEPQASVLLQMGGLAKPYVQEWLEIRRTLGIEAYSKESTLKVLNDQLSASRKEVEELSKALEIAEKALNVIRTSGFIIHIKETARDALTSIAQLREKEG